MPLFGIGIFWRGYKGDIICVEWPKSRREVSFENIWTSENDAFRLSGACGVHGFFGTVRFSLPVLP